MKVLVKPLHLFFLISPLLLLSSGCKETVVVSGGFALGYPSTTGNTAVVGQSLRIEPAFLISSGFPVLDCRTKSGTPSLPEELTIDKETCVISGLPGEVFPLTKITIEAVNSIGQIALADFFFGINLAQSQSSQTAAGIMLDESVSEEEQILIAQDLNRLNELNLSLSSYDLQVIGIENFSGSELTNWISDRIKFIVGESYDYGENANILGSQTYHPEVFSQMLFEDLIEQNSLTTIMVNLGGALYRYGKQNSRLLSLDVGGERIAIKSPRVGVIQIGEGLFSAWSVKSSARDSLANSLIRLSVFFHEGRHSDGNGENVTFPHAMCPDWHDYGGNYSCDNSTNGPYVVDSVMLKNLQGACEGCSNTEIQTFKAFQADAESRLLSGSTWKDIRPEQINWDTEN